MVSPRYTALLTVQAQISGLHAYIFFRNIPARSIVPPLPAASRRKQQQQRRRYRAPETRLEGDDEERQSSPTAKGAAKSPPRRGGFPRDQSFIISLLLLVDPEVTDIERRAMETSL